MAVTPHRSGSLPPWVTIPGEGDLGPAPTEVRVVVAAVLAPLVILTIVGLVALRRAGNGYGFADEFSAERAHRTVTDIEACDLRPGCFSGVVDLTRGPGCEGEHHAGPPRPPPVRPHRGGAAPWRAAAVPFAGPGIAAQPRAHPRASRHLHPVCIDGGAHPAPGRGRDGGRRHDPHPVDLARLHGPGERCHARHPGGARPDRVLGSVPTEVGRFSGLADDASQYIAALNSDVDVGACSWQAPVIGALGCARRRHRHPDCGGVGAGAGRP